MQAALPLMVAGQIVQGIGGYRAGVANKAIANSNSQAALAEGSARAQRIRDASRLQLGKQLGAQAESGFEVGTGTALDSLLESATNAELEAMDARRQAESRALAYRMQGRQAKAEGVNALIGGLFGAAKAVAGAKTDYAAASGGGA